jgi:hypothetical protein
MPLNPSIPLAGNNLSFSQPLIQLGEKRRRDKIDESNLATASQQREIGAQNIALNKSTIEQGQRNLDQGKKELEVRDMERIILEVGAMSNLVNQGNSEEAAKLGMGVREKLIASGQDVTRWDGVLMGIKDNPQAAAQYINQMAEGLKPALASLRAGAGQRMAAPEPLVIKEGDIVLDPQTMQTIASNKEAPVAAPVAPQTLLEGLDSTTSARASAAFQAAGGGSTGLAALNSEVERGAEIQKRTEVPNLLKSSFPQASEAEMSQIRAAVDAAGSVEEGMNEAGKIREGQRTMKKAQAFQVRAIALLDNILSSDQINDVTGGIEGGFVGNIYSSIFSQAQTDLLADIEEVGSILTTDNLDLMTGVLSETDIQLIKDLSAGGLNRKRGEERFKSDVQEMRDRLASQIALTAEDKAQAPEISTEAQYDALPSGASFIQNGQSRKKP